MLSLGGLNVRTRDQTRDVITVCQPKWSRWSTLHNINFVKKHRYYTSTVRDKATEYVRITISAYCSYHRWQYTETPSSRTSFELCAQRDVALTRTNSLVERTSPSGMTYRQLQHKSRRLKLYTSKRALKCFQCIKPCSL